MPRQSTPKVERVCQHCGVVFLTRRSDVERGKGQFCSRRCVGLHFHPPEKIPCVCAHCGKQVMKHRSALDGNAHVFCSSRCAATYYQKAGPDHPRWKGGRQVTSEGYVRVYTPNGRELEHRVVMERMIGRPLGAEEHVHHINGNKADNRRENLQLVSIREHQRIHRMLPYGQWSRHYERCVVCGLRDRKHVGRGLCERCHQHEQYLKRRDRLAQEGDGHIKGE